MRNVTFNEKNKINVSVIKNKIIKLYGSFYDMKCDQKENKYVKKDNDFLTASCRFFINIINIIVICLEFPQ